MSFKERNIFPTHINNKTTHTHKTSKQNSNHIHNDTLSLTIFKPHTNTQTHTVKCIRPSQPIHTRSNKCHSALKQRRVNFVMATTNQTIKN